MNLFSKSTLLLFLLVGTSFLARAQQSVSATATVSATIVAPLAIAKTVDLNFGNVGVTGTLGTVVITPAGVRSVTGGCQISAANPGIVSAASFSITGQGTYTYGITLPSTATTIVNGGNNMTVNTYVSNPSGTGALTAGAQTLTVGGTLNVNASQATGTYTLVGGLQVTVSYN